MWIDDVMCWRPALLRMSVGESWDYDVNRTLQLPSISHALTFHSADALLGLYNGAFYITFLFDLLDLPFLTPRPVGCSPQS